MFSKSLVMLALTVSALEPKESVDIDIIDTSVVIEESTEQSTEEVVDIGDAKLTATVGGTFKMVEVKTQQEKKQEEYDKEIKATKTEDGYTYKIPKNWKSQFKSYMRYTAVTSKSSAQYKLLNSEDAYTDDNGLRMYRGRYCIAMGSGFSNKIGTYIDLVLENGTTLHCVLGDQKADKHTSKNNMVCLSNGSIAEFIVDYDIFLKKKDSSGTVNWVKNFDGKISKVIVYNGKKGSEDLDKEKGFKAVN